MSEPLRLTLLGGVRVQVGAATIDGFTSKKSLALLAYLAVTGRSHYREALSGLLWGESGSNHARASLRTVLWDLRQQLPSFLTADRQTIALDSASSSWVDALVLTRTIGRALESPKETAHRQEDSTLLTDEQVGSLEESLSLYRGDFMAGFFVSDAPGFEDWMLTERESTRQLVLQALHRLLRHYRTRGAYRSAGDVATRLLTIAPWQEETHRELMRLHVLAGQRSAALVQYETCRQKLQEELGVEPTLETRLLYRRIKSGRRLDEEQTQSWLSGLNVSAECLGPRAETQAFVGRDDETAALKQMLSAPGARLVTLVGAPGTGKTRLAWSVIHQVSPSFDDGMWFMSLRPEAGVISRAARDPGDAERGCARAQELETALTMARALGISISALAPVARQVIDFLGQREGLLVLDDFAASPAGVVLIRDILDRCPYVRLLVIAEGPLGIESELVLYLGGLSLPPVVTEGRKVWERPEELMVYDGVRLFVERASRASPGFELTARNARHVARICRSAAGSPLAIELAAAHVDASPPVEMAPSVDYWLDDYGAVSIECEDRGLTRALEALLDYSWDRLSSSEQLGLLRVAILGDQFGQEAASEVADVSPATLRGLVRKGLLFQRSPGRFDWHPALRRLVLGASPTLSVGDGVWDRPVAGAAFQDRYRTYYLDLVARHAPTLRGPGAQAACAEIRADWRHVRHAWYSAVGDADAEGLGRSLEGLRRFLLLQGWHQEGVWVLEAAVGALKPLAADDPRWTPLLVRLSGELARLLNAYGAPERACLGARKVVELARGCGSQSASGVPWSAAEAAGHREWGIALHRQGKLERARKRLEHAARLTDDGLCPEMRAAVLTRLGMVEMDSEGLPEALQHLEQALALYDRLGDHRGQTEVLNQLARVAARSSDLSAAGSYAREAFDLAQTLGDRALEGAAHGNMARVAAAREDYLSATTHSERALRIARDVGDPQAEARALLELVMVHLCTGEKESAWRRSLLAAELANSAGQPMIEARALLLAGHAFTELALTDQAIEAYERARELQSSLGQVAQMVESVAGLARATLVKGEPERAQTLAEGILSCLETVPLGAVREPMRVYLACYQVLEANGDPRARDILARASNLYEEMPLNDSPSNDT